MINNQTSNKIPELLTPEQVASLLGVKRETLQIWRCVGRYNIPYVKIGGCVRYKSSDIQAFIESRVYGGNECEQK